MRKLLGGCCTSRVSVFSIFFAVFFSACAYFYFQYSYTKFIKINFNEWVLYTGEEIFSPVSDSYALYFYSSHIKEQKDFLKNLTIPEQRPVIAIDLYQFHEKGIHNGIVFASAGVNTILKYINRFKITELPVIVDIEREKVDLYHQSSRVRTISIQSLREK